MNEVVQAIFTIATAALASGFVTASVTQLLKWEAIAIPAKKYPLPIAVVLSLATSAASVFVLDLVPLQGVGNWFVFSAATLLVATQSYDIVHKAIEQLTNTNR